MKFNKYLLLIFIIIIIVIYTNYKKITYSSYGNGLRPNMRNNFVGLGRLPDELMVMTH